MHIHVVHDPLLFIVLSESYPDVVVNLNFRLRFIIFLNLVCRQVQYCSNFCFYVGVSLSSGI